MTARDEGRGAAVEYQLSSAFPAEPFLEELKVRMERGGWKAEDYVFLNPTIPSSLLRGWTYHYDTRPSPHVGVHQWQANWRNQNGDVVKYSLRYFSPWNDFHKLSTPTNTALHVTAFLIPSAKAKALAAEASRALGQ